LSNPDWLFLNIEDNYFTFEAVKAGLAYNLGDYLYENQKNFPLKTAQVGAQTGANVDINIEALSTNRLGGIAKHYEWFKGSVSMGSPSQSSVLTITGISAADYDTYYCQVTDDNVPVLTLKSDEFTLIENTTPTVANPITDKTKNEGFVSLNIDLINVFTDSDGDVLIYSALSANTNIATVSVNGNILTVTEIATGTTSITVTADDGFWWTAEDEFDLTINAIPTIANSITDKTENEGFRSSTIDLSNVFTDVDGDVLNFSTVSENTNIATVSVNGNILTVTEIATGTTSITVTADDGKGGTVDDEFLLTVSTTTSVRKLAKNGFKVYPIPSAGPITIENARPGKNTSLKIVNMTGKTVLQKELNHSKTMINLSKYRKGVYFISLIKGGEKVISKIIVN